MELENKIINFLKREKINNQDAAHDLGHLTRVAEKSKHIHKYEGGNLDVIIIGSYFHDIVSLPKNSLIRHCSATFSAQKTIKILKENFKEISTSLYGQISDVIRTHSYSSGIKPITIEAKIIQDADRLDALGAIGLARVFYVAGKLGQEIYSDEDPFAIERSLDDKKYALDHFYTKLLRLPDTINTEAGKIMAKKRVAYLSGYIDKLKEEITLTNITEK
ncbi:HD domain-containing protein [Klebsiella sp. BIGb0407]|uniref:HD domain-containing protein n=1 Tax=Klebsiella sp. BIGb0407 TaxID=2940603 RepID=UPI0021671D63|nr:HD domain-containing protein [Klebsiella sp. BIGb0407]MCS3433547.1 uncharacterized protein [Klebsiella sp. BIGb0407]